MHSKIKKHFFYFAMLRCSLTSCNKVSARRAKNKMKIKKFSFFLPSRLTWRSRVVQTKCIKTSLFLVCSQLWVEDGRFVFIVVLVKTCFEGAVILRYDIGMPSECPRDDIGLFSSFLLCNFGGVLHAFRLQKYKEKKGKANFL